MSGYRDRKIFDTCYNDVYNDEDLKRSNYYFYPGYRTNDNSCINYPTSETNIFGNKLNEIGNRSEIESLLQLRNYVDVNVDKLNYTNSKCSNNSSNKVNKYKNVILDNKMKNYYNENILYMCPIGYEILNSRLDILENR